MELDNSPNIQSPYGVSMLMENLWLRSKAGLKQRPCQVFMVELPPPIEQELAEDRRPKNLDTRLQDEEDADEYFGAWI